VKLLGSSIFDTVMITMTAEDLRRQLQLQSEMQGFLHRAVHKSVSSFGRNDGSLATVRKVQAEATAKVAATDMGKRFPAPIDNL
jgi:hypothetical protein